MVWKDTLQIDEFWLVRKCGFFSFALFAQNFFWNSITTIIAFHSIPFSRVSLQILRAKSQIYESHLYLQTKNDTYYNKYKTELNVISLI